jgi:manganese/iron transport system substrate-binding protein
MHPVIDRRLCLRLLGGAALVVSQPATHARAAPGEKLRVSTTFTVIADMARNVAGEAAEIVSLTRPGAEIHGYQPTPGDLLSAQSTRLVLWNGLGLERWFERFFASLDNVASATLSDAIEPIPIAIGPYRGRPNPHAWMSPKNALIYVENIRKALAAADPERADIYAANAARYAAEINTLDAPLRARFSAIPEARRWLVTSEGAFSYLAADYGLKELYIWPMNADRQGTPQQVRQVIDIIRRESIPVIFSESTVSDKPAKQVAAETGARYGGVLYVDQLSEADGPVPTYLKLLATTVETVASGLEA